MNHYQLETDIQHLEQVLTHISLNDRIPLSYWRKRVDSLTSVASVPSQRSRVKKLNEALRALEVRAQT
ncbi:hypothetical protein [Paraburkholderia rhizosphaerae]|uniref:Uncharacterized protein n=1 Tax=Paraburkholderia rhizosphaerae TaxID=480658 RepID=A0A4R8LAC5_9BURK|nr:hypothetical protein [Paraburkholderia rhizosphaerae]TDY38910.1 hypothetical protein BX592_12926 [Paraburkholderia rhizosphaerae]